jgi:hypothetical protein
MKFGVFYSPALDSAVAEGIWNVDNNTVALSWRLFNEFRNEKDMRRRRELLESIPKSSNYEISK